LKIFIVRHGQTDFNAEGRNQFPTTPLNSNGMAQAQTAADKIAKLKIEHFYASDFMRARQTAEIINKKLNLPIIFDKRLREKHNGDVAGKVQKEIPDIMNDYYKNPHKYNAESFEDVFVRVKNFFDELKKSGKNNVLLVTHSHTMNTMLYYFTGKQWNYEKFLNGMVHVKNGEVLEFDI